MNPTNVAVVICSVIVGLIRLYVFWSHLTGYRTVMNAPSENLVQWRAPVILALAMEFAPFVSCMISVGLASRGHTAWGLRVQLATFSLLSIYDLISAKLWWQLLPKLKLWQKFSVYAVGALSFGGTVAAICLPTPYTTFASSLIFLIMYTYLTQQLWDWPRRWLPYLVFTLLLSGAALALGILVFEYKKPQLSEYLFLALNLLHPRTIYGYLSVFRDPLKSAVNKVNPPSHSTSTSALNTNPLPLVEDNYHFHISGEQVSSPYHHRGGQGKGKGFAPEAV